MVKCPWCNEWEGPPSQYSDHLKYCKKYPPNIEAMKERIDVQIKVNKMNGLGISKLQHEFAINGS